MKQKEIHFHQTTILTPQQYIAGLTNFGPGRSKLFGNSADGYLKVHHRGLSEADVTEGSGGIWERLHYDWSDPNHVVLTTIDSNVWGGASGHIYTFTRQPNGTTDIDVTVVREGKNLKGWLVASCYVPSADMFWKMRSLTPSKPSKRGPARQESKPCPRCRHSGARPAAKRLIKIGFKYARSRSEINEALFKLLDPLKTRFRS